MLGASRSAHPGRGLKDLLQFFHSLLRSCYPEDPFDISSFSPSRERRGRSVFWTLAQVDYFHRSAQICTKFIPSNMKISPGYSPKLLLLNRGCHKLSSVILCSLTLSHRLHLPPPAVCLLTILFEIESNFSYDYRDIAPNVLIPIFTSHRDGDTSVFEGDSKRQAKNSTPFI